jgi:hypothetical protein
MWDPNVASTASSGGAGAATARYSYLIGRLRSRQITMEEATELFGLMQGMLARSETGRQALMAASRARTPPAKASPVSSDTPRVPAVVGPTDDLLLFGLLAMGAGSGLVAALAKRIQQGPSPTTAPDGSSTSDSRTG